MSWPDDTAVPLPGNWEAGYADYREAHPAEFGFAGPAWNDSVSQWLEGVQRGLLPNGRIEDFAVGFNRVITGTVGSRNQRQGGGGYNPSWGDALLLTADDFSPDYVWRYTGDWTQPGTQKDSDSPLADDLKEKGLPLLLIAGALGAAVVFR